MTDPILLMYVTCPDTDSAHRIGLRLVEAKLAACINVLAPMTSIYEWKGGLEQSQEVPVLIKTREGHAELARELILAEHPYDCPCILEWPVSGGHEPFLDWIRRQTLASDVTTASGA